MPKMHISSFHDNAFEGKYGEFVSDLGLLRKTKKKKKKSKTTAQALASVIGDF